MKASKKDFIEVAKIINKLDNNGSIRTINLTALLADMFAVSNYRFDREKFFQACKGKEGEK